MSNLVILQDWQMRTGSNEMNIPGGRRESARSDPPYNQEDSGCSTLGEADMVPADGAPAPWKSRTSSSRGQVWSRMDPEARNQTSTSRQQVSLAVRCSFGFLMLLSEALLIACMVLVLFWIFYYQDGVSWDPEAEQGFNLHYILMVAGFIFFNGQAMLIYRCCCFCKKVYQKAFHAFLFVLSIAAITVGMVVAIRGMENVHFYTLHSWMGLGAIGLFALQFIIGFISFLVLPCCDDRTAKFRQRLLPTHVTFGLVTFCLGSAATLTGLMESADGVFDGEDGRPDYRKRGDQAIVVNTLAMTIVGLVILLPFILLNKTFKRYTSHALIN